MKEYIKNHKRQLLQLLLALGIGVVISLIFLLIFYFTGVIYYDEGFKINAELFADLRNNVRLYVVFVVVDAIGCTLLCMNPIGSGTFVRLGMALFGANWKCFLATFLGCFLGYVIIDAVGRFGGSRLIIKIFGAEEYEKMEKVINEKGLVYVPIMYLLPLFPDDFVCLVVGSMKMKWWVHLVFCAIGKAIGIATVVFGISFVPKDLFLPFGTDKLYNYFVFIACLIVYITCLFKGARWLDKKISKLLTQKKKGN